MKRLNFEFFDEFKALDNLCIDIFGEANGKRGVSLYIENMEKNARLGEAKIEGWAADYKSLKDARHTRNQLAHSRSSFSEKMCTREQLEFVRSFKARMCKGEDPLSLLQKLPESKKSHGCIGKIVFLLLIALIAACIVKFLILK